jgi:hypothetical protein
MTKAGERMINFIIYLLTVYIELLKYTSGFFALFINLFIYLLLFGDKIETADGTK